MDSLLKGQNRVSNQKVSKLEGLPNIQTLRHPVLMKDSSIVVGGESFFKMDNNSKLIWINTNIEAHHSLELDHENNLWISGRRLYSKLPELIDKENTEFFITFYFLLSCINPLSKCYSSCHFP